MNRKLPQKLAIPAALRRCFVGAAALAPGFALANPTGGQVVAGQASISNPAANGTLVNQSSQSAIVNWQQFNVAGNEYVQFAQPSSSAVILNRVIGGAPSEIFGSIRANGRVFLVNTQGVLFAPGAQVDVGSLVASTLDIKNEDFLAGRYVFSGGTPGAGVTNEGTIHAADGGFVVLQGDYAHNTGIVQAKLGQVVLAGGSATTLTLGSDGLVSFAVDEAAVSAQAAVSNAGDIIADGGKVLMTAKVARGLVATAVNNTGRISAQGIVDHNGEIELTAAGGNVVDSGTLDVSNTAGSGGKVDITGDGNIDVQSGAQILASGSTSGGSVRIVADGDLQVRSGSSIVATGGSIGGNVELSGHGSMKSRGTVKLSRGGTLTLDPTNLVIADGAGSSSSATVYEQAIESQLQNGINVNLVATNSITLNALTDGVLDGQDLQVPGGGGNLFMGIGTMNPASGIFTEGTGGTIAFQNKANTINVDGTFTVRGGTTSGTIDIGNVVAKGVDVTVANGPGATGGTLTVGNLTIGSGSFSIFEGDIAGHTTTIGNVVYSGGPLSFNAQNLNLVTGSIDADAVDIHMVNGSVTTGDLIAEQGSVSVVSNKASITVGNVSASDIFPSGNTDASVTLSAATGIHAGSISTQAAVTDGSGDAKADVTLSTTSGDISVAGSIITSAFAGGSSHAATGVVSITSTSGNITATGDIDTRATGGTAPLNSIVISTGGNVTTSGLNAYNSGVSVTGNNLNIGLVSGNSSDGTVGTLAALDLDAKGTLTLANTSITAGTIKLSAGQGNLSFGSLVANNGSVSVATKSGTVQVGNISTSDFLTTGAADASVKLSATTGIKVGAISTDASGGQTNSADASVTLSTTGGNVDITGTIDTVAEVTGVNQTADAHVKVSAANGIAIAGISTSASGSGQGNVADGSIALTTTGGAIGITGTITAGAFTSGGGALSNSKATVSITNNGGGIATSNIFTRASGSGTVANDIAINATGDVNTGNLAAASAGITVSGNNIDLGSLAGSPVSSGASVRGPSLVKAAGPALGSGGGLTNVVLDASGTLSYSNTSLTAGTISLRNGSGNLNAGGLTATTGGLHVDVAGNVTAGSGSAISANDLAIKAGGTINIANATVTVGTGATSFGADPALINAIKNDPKGQGIQLPPSSSPNAAFKAHSVQIGTITVGGGYLYVQADDYSIGQVNGPLDANQHPLTLLNVLPYSAQSNWTIPGVQLVATGLVASGTAAGHTSTTAATTTTASQPTLVIPPGIGTVAFGGSAFTGNIVVPAGTMVSPDTTNLVFATQGTIANADALSTSGVIVLLGRVVTGLDEVPLLPQNYKPGFDHGIGWLPAPGDIYYSGVNDSNEGLIEPQSDAQAVLVCGGVQ